MHVPTIRWPFLAASALLALASLPLQAACLPPADEASLARLPDPLLAEPESAPAGTFRLVDAQGRTHLVSGMEIDYGAYASGFLSAFGTHRAAPLRSGFLVRDGNGLLRIDWARVQRLRITREPVYLLQASDDAPVTCMDDRRRWEKEAAQATSSKATFRLLAEVEWRDGRRGTYELVSDSIAGTSGLSADGAWAIRLADVREVVPAAR